MCTDNDLNYTWQNKFQLGIIWPHEVRKLPSATVCIRLGFIWHLWPNTILMVFWWRSWLYRVQRRLFSLSRFKIAQAVPKKIRDPATHRQFQSALKVKTSTVAAVSTAAGSDSDTANRVDSTWSKLKKPLQDSTTEVCGPSNSYKWLPETWRWNGQVNEYIQGKCLQFKA